MLCPVRDPVHDQTLWVFHHLIVVFESSRKKKINKSPCVLNNRDFNCSAEEVWARVSMRTGWAMLCRKLVKNLNTRIIVYIKNLVSVLLKFSLSQISVFRSQRHEQLLYALKSEKNKLKTHYKKWAVNKKILNQTYQLKALLYETSLQVPELKHPPL